MGNLIGETSIFGIPIIRIIIAIGIIILIIVCIFFVFDWLLIPRTLSGIREYCYAQVEESKKLSQSIARIEKSLKGIEDSSQESTQALKEIANSLKALEKLATTTENANSIEEKK